MSRAPRRRAPALSIIEGSDDESEQNAVGKGDFTEIAALMRQSGEELVKSLGITGSRNQVVGS